MAMATATIERPACAPSPFWRFAADACRQAIHAAHDARLLKTIAEDAVETRMYDATHRIRKHPFIAVGVAFAVGVPLGLLVGWAGARTARARR
jgi:hypothetical protein